MKKLIIMTILLLSTSVFAEDRHKQFEEIEEKTTQIAFIDLSEKSMQWLIINQKILKEKRIAVMLIGGSAKDAQRLYQQYGVLVGPEPEPKKYTKKLLESLGITELPALVN